MVTNAGKDMKKLEPSHTTSERVKYYNHIGNSLVIPQEINMELPFDPVIQFLVDCVYTQEQRKRIPLQKLIHKCLQQHYSQQSKGRTDATSMSINWWVDK